MVKQEKKEVSKPKTKVQKKWILAEIATQTDQVILNTKTNKQFTIAEGIVELLNKVDKINKTLSQ